MPSTITCRRRYNGVLIWRNPYSESSASLPGDVIDIPEDNEKTTMKVSTKARLQVDQPPKVSVGGRDATEVLPNLAHCQHHPKYSSLGPLTGLPTVL
ncbi:unnamed protein product [Nezara viridula]|uniref:Uncharacterized protein n=1 Tax=Nezara viridula TaxID=85310 RepID=A0A9P0HI89_NEZVI|nr:unnamed protein product [Nezara viridula]